MPEPISLKYIAEKLEEANDEYRQLLLLQSNEIVSAQTEYLGIAEEMESESELAAYPEWKQDSTRDAAALLAQEGGYLLLPSQHSIHEYAIMRDFAYTVSDDRAREILLLALNGSGAFRRFKDALILTELRESWFRFRFDALVSIARDWCKQHRLPYRD